MTDRINALVAVFTEATKIEVRKLGIGATGYGYMREFDARNWLNAGYTVDDLNLVIAFYRRTVDKPAILARMLTWRYLIGQPEQFGDDLALAKMQKAKNHQTPRQSVLKATGRVESKQTEPKTAKEVILSPAGQAAFEAFRAFRQQLEQL